MPVLLEGGGRRAVLEAEAFTLAWTHSVEKVRWEEDWRVENGQLVIAEARIKGSGAGMEPPEGARFEDGWWKYRPDLPPQREVRLARSGVVADYEVCVAGEGCRALGSLLPGIADDVGVTVAAWP